MKNAGAVATNALTATITVPQSVVFDHWTGVGPGSSQQWACVRTSDHLVTCTRAALAPGDSAAITVPASVFWATTGSAVVEVADGAAVITASAPLHAWWFDGIAPQQVPGT